MVHWVKWVKWNGSFSKTRKINGGGPEYTFKNMQGDIIIRKQ